MDRHQNPYTPGAGARPPLLAGRDRDLEDFGVAFQRLGAGQFARSFMIDGLRGVGKTVLLNEADVMAREHGWISSGVVECNEDDELTLLMARLCHRALRRLDWLAWLEEVKGAKPSTVADYRFLLREPGIPYKRGNRTSSGRIMAAFGDRPAADVTMADVSRFLRSLDQKGLTPRNVNKHREVLSSMFMYGCRTDTLSLSANPVDGTDKRRQDPPAALDYYEVEEVEALARACERAEHRVPSNMIDADELAARELEDRRDADAFRLLFYTGLRIGEMLTLRWEDVDLGDRLLLVRRGLSAGHETLPKGRRHRFVPLPTPAVAALARLADRNEFAGPDDYVLCNRWGRRLDASALRRRYKRACEAAGLRPVKLHGLRHAAGSLIARTNDAVFVRDFLGHAKLTTTDRYLSAKRRPEELERLDRAFAPSALAQDPANTRRDGIEHS